VLWPSVPTACSSTPIGGLRRTQRAQPCCATSEDKGKEILALQGACLAALPLLLKASAASADDFGPPATKGIGIAEVVVLASPLLLYGLFTVYREKVNPKATISDFLFITAGIVIVGNILSILVFKIRLF